MPLGLQRNWRPKGLGGSSPPLRTTCGGGEIGSRTSKTTRQTSPPLSLTDAFQVYTLNVTNLDTLAVISHWSDACLGIHFHQKRRRSPAHSSGYSRRPTHPDRMLHGTTLVVAGSNPAVGRKTFVAQLVEHQSKTSQAISPVFFFGWMLQGLHFRFDS